MGDVLSKSEYCNLRSVWDSRPKSLYNSVIKLSIRDVSSSYADIKIFFGWNVLNIVYTYSTKIWRVKKDEGYDIISSKYAINIKDIKKFIVSILNGCDSVGIKIDFISFDTTSHFASYKEMWNGNSGYDVYVCCSNLYKLTKMLELPCSVENVSSILNILYETDKYSYSNRLSDDIFIEVDSYLRTNFKLLRAKRIKREQMYVLIDGNVGISAKGDMINTERYRTFVHLINSIDVDDILYLRNHCKNPCLKLKLKGVETVTKRGRNYILKDVNKYAYSVDYLSVAGSYSTTEYALLEDFYNALKGVLRNSYGEDYHIY